VTRQLTKKYLYIIVFGILATVILMSTFVYIVYFRMATTSTGNQNNNNQQTQNEFIQTLPVRFTVSDKWAGGASSSATITVYTDDLETFDSGTTDSNGVWTSNKAMKSGTHYWVKLSKSNAIEYYSFTVPNATSTGQVYHYQSLDFYTLGAISITMQMPNGTLLSDGSTYNVTEAGNEYPTFTVQLRNSQSSDSGFVDYYDPIKDLLRETYFYFKLSGNQYEQIVVKNVDLLYQASSARYYGFKLDPYKLTIDKKPDGTYNQYNGEDMDGIWSFSIQFDCAGMTDNSDGPEIAFYVYTHGNLNNFETYGTNLSDSVELQSTDYDFEIDA